MRTSGRASVRFPLAVECRRRRNAGDDAVALVSLRWGLVPSWWTKDLKDVPATFNARAETVADKPMFPDAFRRRRCIVPASGYDEWRHARERGRQPWYVSAADGGVLSFTGLWDGTQGPIRRPASCCGPAPSS